MNQYKKVIEISDPTPYQQAEKKRRPDPYQKKRRRAVMGTLSCSSAMLVSSHTSIIKD
jgi:hypothetical protein